MVCVPYQVYNSFMIYQDLCGKPLKHDWAARAVFPKNLRNFRRLLVSLLLKYTAKKIYRLPSLICFSSFCLNHVSKRIALLFVYSDQLLKKGLLLLLFFVLFLLFKIIILGRCYTRWSWVSTLFSWQEEIQEEVQKVWSCKCWLLQRYNVITTKFFMLNNVTIIIK